MSGISAQSGVNIMPKTLRDSTKMTHLRGHWVLSLHSPKLIDLDLVEWFRMAPLKDKNLLNKKTMLVMLAWRLSTYASHFCMVPTTSGARGNLKKRGKDPKISKLCTNFHVLGVLVKLYRTPNVINQLRRPNLTYSEGFVKFCEDLTEVGVFEENMTHERTDKQTH